MVETGFSVLKREFGEALKVRLLGLQVEEKDLRNPATRPADQHNKTTEERSVDESRKITDLDCINILAAAQWEVSRVKTAECYFRKGNRRSACQEQPVSDKALPQPGEPYVE